MKTAMEIFNAAFHPVRDPRSDEYKQGVLAALSFRIGGQKIPHPYPMGTTQADAFYAGIDEGHRRWRMEQDAD